MSYKEDRIKDGEACEKMAEFYFIMNYIPYSIPDKKTRKNKGIDYIAKGFATDAKATLKIIFGNYRLEEKMFMPRMPFFKSCGATHYLILNSIPNPGDGNLYSFIASYFGSIKEYLGKNYLKEEKYFETIKEILDSRKGKNFKYFGHDSIRDFFTDLKSEMTQFLRNDIEIFFKDERSIYSNTEELIFYMIKKNDIEEDRRRTKVWSEMMRKKNIFEAMEEIQEIRKKLK